MISDSELLQEIVEKNKAREQFHKDVEHARFIAGYSPPHHFEDAFNVAMRMAGYEKVIVQGPIGLETEVELSPSIQYHGRVEECMQNMGLKWAWKRK